jgi:hypothetical protein
MDTAAAAEAAATLSENLSDAVLTAFHIKRLAQWNGFSYFVQHVRKRHLKRAREYRLKLTILFTPRRHPTPLKLEHALITNARTVQLVAGRHHVGKITLISFGGLARSADTMHVRMEVVVAENTNRSREWWNQWYMSAKTPQVIVKKRSLLSLTTSPSKTTSPLRLMRRQKSVHT